MAAKGTIAKNEVIKKIAQAFGTDFIGEYDKKIYVWGQENGEKVQVALSLTCPKVQVNVVNPAVDLNFGNSSAEIDFENMGAPVVAQSTFAPAEVTEEELQNINELMARLGL